MLLTVRNLCVTYHGLAGDVGAVEKMDFEIAVGEAVGLVGESGSGKSTVALALMGLLPRKAATVAGEAWFEDRELLSMPQSKLRHVRGDRIGMIFQDPMTSLNPYLKVGRQVMETPVAHGMARESARAVAIDLLAAMHLPAPETAFQRYPHHYSGGMRQRAMSASAFSGNPALLIADEPTTALDVITQDRVLRLMKSELTRRGMSLLLITHDLGIVAGICDKVVVMRDGKVVENAAVKRLYAMPEHSYTRDLLAAVPRIDQIQPGAKRASRRAEVAAAGRSVNAVQPLVAIDRLSVEFKHGVTTVRAVDDVSLQVLVGEVLGLVGQSGSGKSTLARAIAGLNHPIAGTIAVGGVQVDCRNRRALKTLRRAVQLVFQDPRNSLNSRLTVARIIAEPLVNFGLASRREALKRAHELMGLVNLPASWGVRYPHELSGGQCQRVGIARALAVSPKLLLCDEPVSALDVSIQAEILDLLAALRERLGLTLLFISHDLAVVRNVADRVAVMQEGKIVELKTAAELYDSAEHDYTKTLLAAVPIPDPEVYRL